MKTRTKENATPNMLNRVTVTLFVPFLMFHFAYLVPVVEWSCICPEGDLHVSCCCNCPKCVKRRGGFESYCHLRHGEAREAVLQNGIQTEIRIDSKEHPDSLERYHVSLDTYGCDCNSHIKKISLDITPLLPPVKICCFIPKPAPATSTPDDRWPPEVVPCQPEVPG